MIIMAVPVIMILAVIVVMRMVVVVVVMVGHITLTFKAKLTDCFHSSKE